VLLDSILAADNTADSNELLDLLVQRIQQVLENSGSLPSSGYLPKLVDLCVRYPDLNGADALVATALNSCVPLGLDGLHLTNVKESPSMRAVCDRAAMAWQHRADARDCHHKSIVSFLEREVWTDDIVNIVTKMVYLHHEARDAMGEFIGSTRSTAVKPIHLARCIAAWLDASDERIQNPANLLIVHFIRIFRVLLADEHEHSRIALVLIFRKVPEFRYELLNLMREELNSYSATMFCSDIALFSEMLCEIELEASMEMCSAIFDHGMKWAAHAYAGSDDVDSSVVIALGMCSKPEYGFKS
jgi:hypothetical protein